MFYVCIADVKQPSVYLIPKHGANDVVKQCKFYQILEVDISQGSGWWVKLNGITK